MKKLYILLSLCTLMSGYLYSADQDSKNKKETKEKKERNARM